MWEGWERSVRCLKWLGEMRTKEELVCCVVVQLTACWDTRVVEAKTLLVGMLEAKEQVRSKVVMGSDRFVISIWCLMIF